MKLAIVVHRPAASQLTPFFDRSFFDRSFFYRSISVLLPFRCTHRTTVLTVPLYGKVFLIVIKRHRIVHNMESSISKINHGQASGCGFDSDSSGTWSCNR